MAGPPGRGTPGPPRRRPGRRELGVSGEDLAAAWYIAQGYDVVARNWRCREGELDLVVLRNRVVVFCEVKTRSSELFGAPAEAVTSAKRSRIRRLAARFLDEAAPVRAREIRFDVAAVRDGQVEVLEGAF